MCSTQGLCVPGCALLGCSSPDTCGNDGHCHACTDACDPAQCTNPNAVCGADGQRYCDACHAQCAGTPVTTCPQPQSDGGIGGFGGSCTSDAQCGGGLGGLGGILPVVCSLGICAPGCGLFSLCPTGTACQSDGHCSGDGSTGGTGSTGSTGATTFTPGPCAGTSALVPGGRQVLGSTGLEHDRISPDGAHVVSLWSGGTLLVTPTAAACATPMNLGAAQWPVTFSPDGKLMSWVNAAGTLGLTNLSTGATVSTTGSAPDQLAWADDSVHLLAGDGQSSFLGAASAGPLYLVAASGTSRKLGDSVTFSQVTFVAGRAKALFLDGATMKLADLHTGGVSTLAQSVTNASVSGDGLAYGYSSGGNVYAALVGAPAVLVGAGDFPNFGDDHAKLAYVSGTDLLWAPLPTSPSPHAVTLTTRADAAFPFPLTPYTSFVGYTATDATNRDGAFVVAPGSSPVSLCASVATTPPALSADHAHLAWGCTTGLAAAALSGATASSLGELSGVADGDWTLLADGTGVVARRSTGQLEAHRFSAWNTPLALGPATTAQGWFFELAGRGEVVYAGNFAGAAGTLGVAPLSGGAGRTLASGIIKLDAAARTGQVAAVIGSGAEAGIWFWPNP